MLQGPEYDTSELLVCFWRPSPDHRAGQIIPQSTGQFSEIVTGKHQIEFARSGIKVTYFDMLDRLLKLLGGNVDALHSLRGIKLRGAQE